jgi:hypothetical protein
MSCAPIATTRLLDRPLSRAMTRILRATHSRWSMIPKSCRLSDKIMLKINEMSQLQNCVGAVNYWDLRADF